MGNPGIGAFNVFNAEQVHEYSGSLKGSCPVIIQITPVARDYLHPLMLEGIITAAEKIYPEVDFSVHLDHGNYDHCINAIESGFYNSIMIDASHESFSENIRITGEIVRIAHSGNISVEAELGVMSGIEGNLSVEEKCSFTDPPQAEEFVKVPMR
jgi:fructose-bisphosphate aldolase class II